jgi:hypothetical protein
VSGSKDNLLMWSHYSDSHRGFCVGLDSDRLQKHFKMLADQGRLIVENLKVQYCTEYPAWNTLELDGLEWLTQQFEVKSSDWSYEREWRYILFDKTNHRLDIPKEAIVEVILGCDMSEEHRSEIIQVLRDRAIRAKLYQAVKSKSAYALEFKPVEY